MSVHYAYVLCLTGDIHKHLYSMCGLLRPSDNIKLVSFILRVSLIFRIIQFLVSVVLQLLDSLTDDDH